MDLKCHIDHLSHACIWVYFWVFYYFPILLFLCFYSGSSTILFKLLQRVHSLNLIYFKVLWGFFAMHMNSSSILPGKPHGHCQGTNTLIHTPQLPAFGKRQFSPERMEVLGLGGTLGKQSLPYL